MFYMIKKGDDFAVYQGVRPPTIKVESLDIPARELTPNHRWKKVTARLIRLTVKGGKELGKIPRYNARFYTNDRVPSVGEVTTIPKDREEHIKALFPKKRRT